MLVAWFVITLPVWKLPSNWWDTSLESHTLASYEIIQSYWSHGM